MREWMDLELLTQRHEQMVREAEENRLASVLRERSKRRSAGVRESSLVWELKRLGGHLLKLLRSLKRARQ